MQRPQRPASTVAPPSLLPFMVAGVLVLLALNVVHMLWEWWGSPTVQVPHHISANNPTPTAPRQVDVPIFGHNLQFGQSTAAATLIIFTDPACAACRAQVSRALASLPDSANSAGVRVVYKFWPINPQNPNGGLVTEIARREGATLPFMHALEADPGAQNDDLLAVLERAGVPLDKQQDWLKNHTDDLIANLNEDITQGQQLHLGAAPQFILNGYVLANDSLPVAQLPTYVQRINAGQPIAQPDDYFLNP